MTTPTELNGYPVILVEQHTNCSTVMMKASNKYIVATWSPYYGSGWTWGHYFHFDNHLSDMKGSLKQAIDCFEEIAKNNSSR